MVRLPDIPIASWLQDQQDRFKEATDGLMPALDFQLGARDLESQIPPDFDAPGGMDQWQEAERKQIEDEARQQQQRAEEQRQQELAQQTEQFRQQQAQAEQAQQDAVMQQIQGRGILTPDQAFAAFERPPDNTSSAVLGGAPPPAPASPVDQFNDHANGLMYDTFGQPDDQPPPDNTSSGVLGNIGSAISSGLSTARDAVGSALTYTPDPSSDPTNPHIPARSLADAAQAVVDIPGTMVGQYGSNQGRMQEIEAQDPNQAQDPRSILTGDLSPTYRATHPDEAAEHDRLQQEQMLAVGGMSGTMGGGSMAEDAINAIRSLRAAGLEDEALNAAKGLASKTSLTLDEIMSRIGGPGAATEAAPLAPEEPVATNLSTAETTKNVEASPIPEKVQQQFAQEIEDSMVDILSPTGESAREQYATHNQGLPVYAREAANDEAYQEAFQANLRRLGFPDNVILYRGHHIDRPALGGEFINAAMDEQTARSFRRGYQPPIPESDWRVEAFQVPRESIIGFGHPEESEVIVRTGDIRTAPDIRTVDPVLADLTDVTPPRRYTPEEAVQAQLPGFEDVPEAPAPRENIQGFGTVPEEPLPGEDVIRGMNALEAETPERASIRLADTNRMAADLLQADPEAIKPVLNRALGMDRQQTAVEQSMLKQNVRTWGEAFDRTINQVQDLRQQILDHQQRNEQVPDELSNELRLRTSDLASVLNSLRQGVRGQSLSVSAYSAGLNAQRGGFLGAMSHAVANRLQDVGEAAGRARDALRRAVQDPQARVSDDMLGILRELNNKLSERAIKTISESGGTVEEVGRLGPARGRENLLKPGEAEGGEGAARGGGGGRGRGTTSSASGAAAPREETLAEALGRLKREQGRLEDAGMAPDHPDLVEIQNGIDDVLGQMRDEANNIAERRMQKSGNGAMTPPPSAAEAERMINEAIGRRAQARIRSEAMAEAKGFRTPEVEATKLTAATEDAMRKALDRHVRDTEKLQKSIDAQVQRRVDGMLAQERRASVREQVRGMAREAQYWADKVRKEQSPTIRAELEDKLNAQLAQMADHSNVGERVARDLRERLGVNIQEDAYQQAFREAKQASDALRESRLRGVKEQIRQVMANPNAPGRAERITQLFKDLDELAPQLGQRSSDIRRRNFVAGIDRAGLAAHTAGGENSKELADMLVAMDPKDPQSMRAALNTMIRPSLWKMWREMSFINMLSRPTTLLTNVLSTSENAILKLALRNPLEFILSGGHTVGARDALAGTVRGAGEGGRLFGTIMKSGINPERFNAAVASGRMEHVGQEQIPQFFDQFGFLGRRLGDVGRLYHFISTRPLEASDALMGHMVYAGEYARQARQYIADEMRAGKDLSYMTTPGSKLSTENQAFRYILDNPWDFPEIQAKAGKIQDYILYRTRGKGVFESSLRRILGQKEVAVDAPLKDKLAAWAIDFVMPFFNVPYNFTKQGISQVTSPVWELPQGIAAGLRGDRTAQGEHLAKAVQGGAMLYAASALFSGNNLTAAGPSDAGDRKVWGLDHSPYSFRIPGTDNWISYEGTPLAIPFATIAGAGEYLEYEMKHDPNMSEQDKMVARLEGGAGGALQGALSQTFLQAAERNFQLISGQLPGVNSLSQAMAGNITRYLSPVPFGMVSFLAQMTDAMERDQGRAQSTKDVFYLDENNVPHLGENLINRITYNIPGYREELPVRTNAYGEPVPNERAGGMAFASVYRGPGTRPNDPITQQLERGSIGIPDAPKELSVSKGRGTIPLTIREQQRFQVLYGQAYREALEKVGAGTKEMSVAELEKGRSMARDQAQRQLEAEIGRDELVRRYQGKIPEMVAP